MKASILIALLFLSVSSFSQDTVKLPIHVAKLVIKDLIEFESVKLQLQACHEELSLTNKKCDAKDTIIANYKGKSKLYESRIAIEREKVDMYRDYSQQLLKDYKKLKVKLRLSQIGSGAIVGFLAYLLIVK